MAQFVKFILCLLTGLILNFEIAESLRILGMFPMNGKSHFVMCEAIMRGLAERGHQVDVYSHFPLKKKIANYTDYSLRGTAPILMNNVSYEVINFMSHGVSLPTIMELVGTPVCKILECPVLQKLIRNPPNDPPYDLIILEVFVSDCHLVWGYHLNIPTVMIVTTTLFDWLYEPLGNPTSLATDPGTFAKESHPMTFFQRLDNVIKHYTFKWMYRYYRYEQEALVKKHFRPDAPSLDELVKQVSLTLINHNHAVNGIRAFTPGIVPVGGVHIRESADDLPKEIQKFLDESKNGFLYFTFGSMARIETFPKPTLDAIYRTFRNIAPVRVLMKIAKPEELPPNLPSNVKVEPWFAQVKILKHKNIKAFVTHGGLMGTLEAIYYGVPLIGFPLFGDQYLNIDSYVKKNLSIKLDFRNVTEESFTKAIFEILKNPIYRQSAEETGRCFKDLPMSPMETAIYWIEYVARHEKNKLRSPAVDIPWWQVSLLDVYGFMFAATLLVLYIIKIVLKTIIQLKFPKRHGHTNAKVKKS